MAKYEDIRGDKQEMKALSRAKLTLSFNAEHLSLPGSKINGTRYWDCYLPADICKSL